MTDKPDKFKIARRIVIGMTLLVYLVIWVFLFYALHTVPDEEAGPGFVLGLLLLAGGSFFPYFGIYLVCVINQKGSNHQDYRFALILVLLPPIIAFVDYKVNLSP